MKSPAPTIPLSRPRVSVAMIVRDEQDVLADSIRSVDAFAQEIVVLDTGSTDQTAARAKRMGATVLRMAWADDFSAARNRCLEAVTGDWVLWLDAGEQLTPESVEDLQDFLDRQADSSTVYRLMVELPPVAPGAATEQIAQIRIMPAEALLQFEGAVRESLQKSIAAAGLAVDIAPGRIVRHTREHEPERKLAKAQRNLTLAAQETTRAGQWNTRLLLAAAEACNVLGEQEKAREAYRAALGVCEKGSPEMLEAYYGLLTTFDGDPQCDEIQLATCLEALDKFPFDMQLLLAMGNYLQARHKAVLAIRSYEAAFKFGKVNTEVWHLRDIDEAAAVCLAVALQGQDRDQEACGVLETALRSHEGSPRLEHHLLGAYVKLGRSADAIALADRAAMDPDQREPFRMAIEGACKASQQDWTAALESLQAAYRSGCRSSFCLRWLCVTLLSNGQIEAARPVLDQWRQLEPENAELRSYLAVVGEAPDADASSEGVASVSRSTGDHGRRVRIEPGSDARRGPVPSIPAARLGPPADSAFSPH